MPNVCKLSIGKRTKIVGNRFDMIDQLGFLSVWKFINESCELSSLRLDFQIVL